MAEVKLIQSFMLTQSLEKEHHWNWSDKELEIYRNSQVISRNRAFDYETTYRVLIKRR